MDKLKQDTNKDYTAWDLNCSQYVHKHNRQEWEKLFKRKARRKNKQKMKKCLTTTKICDII